MKRTHPEPAAITFPASAANEVLARMYHEEYRAIRAICSANGLQIALCGDSIRIVSRYDCWRIYLHIRTGEPILFHRSRRPHSGTKVPHYHQQTCTRRSIVQILKYIVNHDLYRTMLDTPPTFRNSTKGRRARKAYEQKQHRRQLARTQAILGELPSFARPPQKEKTS